MQQNSLINHKKKYSSIRKSAMIDTNTRYSSPIPRSRMTDVIVHDGLPGVTSWLHDYIDSLILTQYCSTQHKLLGSHCCCCCMLSSFYWRPKSNFIKAYLLNSANVKASQAKPITNYPNSSNFPYFPYYLYLFLFLPLLSVLDILSLLSLIS